MAQIRELLTGFGFAKQADIATPNVLAGIWRMNSLNLKPVAAHMVSESDAAEGGKGTEFATALYKSHIEFPEYVIDKYVSSEFLTWALAFALGKVTVTGVGPFIYTITPINQAVDLVSELPYFSYIEQMRPGGSSVIDRIYVGNAAKSLKLSLTNSPGRASAKCTVGLVGTGKLVEPSSIAMPAAITLHEINVGGLAITANGVDYVAAKNFVSLDFGWDNNFRVGFYPGSGTQDGFQTQGRFEIGDRACTLTFKARFVNGSLELAKVKALTTGTVVLTLAADASNTITMTLQKVGYSVAELDETDGVVTVAVTCAPLWHATNGLVSVSATTSIGGIAA